MTYEEIFTKSKEIIMQSDVSDIEGGIYNYSRLGAKLVEYKG